MITVYTALFGDLTRDRLAPPPAGECAQHVCFTDGPLSVPGWTVERISSANRSPQFLARLFKVRPDRWFRDQTTIWIDASCQLTKPAIAIVEQAQRLAPVVGLAHPDRQTVDAEAAEVVRIDLAPADVVQQQLAVYRMAGFQTNTGPLTTTGLLVRTPEAQAFNECWEHQIIRFNLRDQLSVDYCAWRTATRLAHLEGSYRQNAYMHYTRHKRVAS